MAIEIFLIPENQTVVLKKAIAKILYGKNYDQLKISEILNLSQPMVSNYCKSKDKISIEFLNYAEEISEKIANGQKIRFHVSVSFSNKMVRGSFFIAQKNELISEEKSKIIDSLTEAFFILKGKNLGDLIPEVKINIAMTKENPVDSNDVAAFKNGLIIVDEKIISNNGIGFGKSRHLSSILLSLKKEINFNAIMNVAYIKSIEKTSLTYEFLSKDFKLKKNETNVDVLLHKGDFGIEPCAYILGKNAIEVVNKILKIKEEII